MIGDLLRNMRIVNKSLTSLACVCLSLEKKQKIREMRVFPLRKSSSLFSTYILPKKKSLWSISEKKKIFIFYTFPSASSPFIVNNFDSFSSLNDTQKRETSSPGLDDFWFFSLGTVCQMMQVRRPRFFVWCQPGSRGFRGGSVKKFGEPFFLGFTEKKIVWAFSAGSIAIIRRLDETLFNPENLEELFVERNLEKPG